MREDYESVSIESKRSTAFLEAIINANQDAISIVDENANLIMFNPAYTKLTGRDERSLNKPIGAFMDGLDEDSIHLKVLKSKQPFIGFKHEKKLHNKNILVNAAPIIIDGLVKGSVATLHDITEINRLANELEEARKIIRKLQGSYDFEDIIGNSEKIMRAIELAKRAAPGPTTILLRGESGTGKELFAHAIHNNSPRKEAQFMRVNCAAINESLFESELFGYEEGAFTGAKRGGRIGLFEKANEGTILLDEIGELSMHMQTKLLRVLQEKEIIKVGASKPTRIDTRFIAATNANLEEMIEKRTFREDLYYRLNTFPIYVPSLRERKTDIPLLALYIAQKHNNQYNRNIQEVSPEAVQVLMNYHWPGNVRELENVILYCMINMKINDTVIKREYLPVMLNKQETAKRPAADNEEVVGDYRNSYLQWEKNLLILALKKYGKKTEAAKNLNMSMRTLYYKLEKHGIE